MAFGLFWRFPYYLFRWKDNDRKELERVQWASQWKSHSFDERRRLDKRKNKRRYFIPRDDFFVLLRDERAGPRRRTTEQCASCKKLFWEGQPFHQHGRELDPCPNERRNPLRCQFCHVIFHDHYALLAHGLCPKSYEIVSEGLADRIQRILRQGVFQSEDKKLFPELLDASLSETVFEQACKSGDFRWRNEETKQENFQRFRKHLFCQLLACIRPKLIDAKSPTSKQLKEADRIQREYFRFPSPRQKAPGQEAAKQEAILCELFFLRSLTDMAKREQLGRPLSPPSAITENPEAKNILEKHEGKKAIAELKAIGLDAPIEKKQRYAWLRKLRNTLGVGSKRRVTSSRNKL